MTASTAYAHPSPQSGDDGVPDRIVFPVVGEVGFRDDFGEPRGQGTHQGNDVMAARKAPVVAVEGGSVSFWTTSWPAGCMLYLYGRSGATYLYIHLNNDVGNANDNRAMDCSAAFAPGLREGQRVRAGQMIAYVGDSGDANGISPHLHFELHPGGGRAVSPYPWLTEARRLLFAFPDSEADPVTVALYGTVRAVTDEGLRVRVERVRLSTGWRGDVLRDATVAVPPEAKVERATGSGREPAALSAGVEGEGVVVWTTPVAGTLREQLGALTAAHVLLRGER